MQSHAAPPPRQSVTSVLMHEDGLFGTCQRAAAGVGLAWVGMSHDGIVPPAAWPGGSVTPRARPPGVVTACHQGA